MTAPSLLVAAALRPEALAVRAGLPDGVPVVRTGMGLRRAARAGAHLRSAPGGALAVVGVCGALADGLEPGDVLVADEVRGPDVALPCPSAPLLAGALRRAGLRARTGPLLSVPRLVTGADRRRLAEGGAAAVDMESAALVAAGGGRPLAVVRVVVDTDRHPLVAPATARNGLAGLRTLRRLGPVLTGWAAAVGPRQVLLAEPRSFCAGVERAIETVERALDLHGPPVYVRKQIVHNTHVVGDLERRGAVFVDELDEVPAGAVVVFSAHGVAPAVWSQARGRELSVIDATCPLVEKVHAEARRFAGRGDTIVLIGHRGHEEVDGTVGEAPERTVLVEHPADVAALSVEDPRRVAYLMQTTLAVDEAATVVDALRQRYPAAVGPGTDDICYATSNRQNAVRAVAREADLVLVVGSANSSNSRRLVEVTEREGVPAHLVGDVGEVRLDWLAGARTVGVTAGASAPPALVDQLVSALSGLGPTSVTVRSIGTESVAFGLPKEVRHL